MTGGGWVDSPAGACSLPPSCDALTTGLVNFGLGSKYKKSKSTPTGRTEIVFSAGDLKFRATSYGPLSLRLFRS